MGMSKKNHQEKAKAEHARNDWLWALEDVDFVLGHFV